MHISHLVRHPFDVAMSAERFNMTPHGDFWKDLTLEEKVARWAFHEKQVLDFKRSGRARVFDVRYEDLCRHPGSEVVKIFRFLNMDIPEQLVRKARRSTHCVIGNRQYISHDNEAFDIMHQYGYSPIISRYANDYGERNSHKMVPDLECRFEAVINRAKTFEALLSM
jgi:hypothetical protein